ncbi:hypothetical protein [Bacillus sp. RC206]
MTPVEYRNHLLDAA